jgi:hypothetical protein
MDGNSVFPYLICVETNGDACYCSQNAQIGSKCSCSSSSVGKPQAVRPKRVSYVDSLYFIRLKYQDIYICDVAKNSRPLDLPPFLI